MSDKTKNIIEWIECIVIAIVLAVLIRYFIGTPTIVKKRSMYPTLKQDERLILSRWGRTTKKMPERGDIITFEAPSKMALSAEEVDLNNPVAVYTNQPKNIFSKFTYYVLEWGKQSFIKRVIGLPGEHIKIEDGKVYINGEEYKEDYLQEDVKTTASGVFTDFVVPENYVFAMGDNRAESTDCRSFGCIPLEKIEGKVVLRFFPFNRFGKVE
ncbi:MAG: signal peptidase I [Clostridia bacterium]